MYVTIRRYQNAGALGDAIASRGDDVKALISAVHGFVSYYASREGDTVTSITVCNDKAGCDETTRLAGQWVKENVNSPIGAPEISGGPVFLNFGKQG